MTRKTILIRRPATIDIVCPSCKSVLTGPRLEFGETATCPQCGHEITTTPFPPPAILVQANHLTELRDLVAAILIGIGGVMVIAIIIAFVRLRLAL
jgi:uncharacterized paraquat-inducible protein A